MPQVPQARSLPRKTSRQETSKAAGKKGQDTTAVAADERLVLDVVADRFRMGADPTGADLDRPA